MRIPETYFEGGIPTVRRLLFLPRNRPDHCEDYDPNFPNGVDESPSGKSPPIACAIGHWAPHRRGLLLLVPTGSDLREVRPHRSSQHRSPRQRKTIGLSHPRGCHRQRRAIDPSHLPRRSHPPLPPGRRPRRPDLRWWAPPNRSRLWRPKPN